VALLALAPSLQAASPATTTSRELVDLGVRPASVSVAADGTSFAAVYDDRLTANALRFAERVDGLWTTTIVASILDGKRVGREPMLAISRTGIRLIAFRSDVSFDPAKPPSGSLYAARSNRGGPWAIDPIDADGFGESVAFDHQGHPAIAYLARTGVGNQAEVRLARLTAGRWQIEHLPAGPGRLERVGGRPRVRSRRNPVRRVRRPGLALGAADHPRHAERPHRGRASGGRAGRRGIRAEPRRRRGRRQPRR